MNLRKAPNNLLRREWIACARAVRVEDEIARRGIKLTGRGPLELLHDCAVLRLVGPSHEEARP
jgi:hypothetical protein